jgi:hypothetical protein
MTNLFGRPTRAISEKYGPMDIFDTFFFMTKYRDQVMEIEGSSYCFWAPIYLEFKKSK